jgi:ribose transport system ATP-binding protein
MAEPLLRVTGLSKSFPGLRALDDVSLDVHSGEIVALVGQNGSGKSTFVKVLAGVHEPDPGATITLARHGEDETGLHFIHQDLGLVMTLSTIENLDLNRPLGWRNVLPSPRRRELRLAEELIRRFDASFDVRRPVGELAAAERAVVAITRALKDWEHSRNVLILDEPTASLHRDEVARLFVSVRRVAEQGAGVVFISHRLDEVIDLADRIAVLRDGRLVADARRGEVDHDALAHLIAGLRPERGREERPRESADVVLRARGVRGSVVQPLDLELRAGEIVGVSGALGSGRDELASVLFGAVDGSVEDLSVRGVDVTPPAPRRSIRAGVAFVPADRHRHGAFMELTVRENMTLPRLGHLRTWYGSLDRRSEGQEVASWIQRVDLRPAEPERPLKLFSGGNQQKVVLAKWLRNAPAVLLMDEPTQGIDVGAKAAIHALIADAAALGTAVLMSSSDTKELAEVCDRVLVMRDGELVAELRRPALSEAEIVATEMGPE